MNKYNIKICVETVVDKSTYRNISWISNIVNKYSIKEWIITQKYIDCKATLSTEDQKNYWKI